MTLPREIEEQMIEIEIDREANAALIASAPTDLARLCDRVEELEAALREIASFDTSGIDRWPSIVTAMRRIAAEALG